MFKNVSAAFVALSLVAVSQPASAQTAGLITNNTAVTIRAISGNIVKISGSLYNPLYINDYFNITAVINTAQTADTAARGIWLNNVPVSSSALKPGMSCFVLGWHRFTSSLAPPSSRLPMDGEPAPSPNSMNIVGFLSKMVCKG